jgi:hypothetical protein
MIDQKKLERKFMIAMLKAENIFAEMEKKFLGTQEEVKNAQGNNTQPAQDVPVSGDGQSPIGGEPIPDNG